MQIFLWLAADLAAYAALGALRNGRSVILTEAFEWIGGQLTSQAVPPDEHSWVEQFESPPAIAPCAPACGNITATTIR